MRLAKGSLSWIITVLIFSFILLIFTIFFWDTVYGFIFLFISLIGFIKTFFLLLFFRDPARQTGVGIVAVADGKIREITRGEDEDYGKYILISTFMNIHNVHVNRMPMNGKITSLTHKNGLHLPAFKKESEKNERVIIDCSTKIGKIRIILIAGTLARRIIPYIKKDDNISKGSKIGIIRLGSRVDIYLPFDKNIDVTVKVGDKIKAGVDTIAEVND